MKSRTSEKPDGQETVLAALRWVYGYMRPHRAWLFGGIAASLAITGIQLLRVYYISALIDNALKGVTGKLPQIIALLVAVLVVGVVATYLERYATSRLGVYESRDLRNAMADRLKDLSVAFFDQSRTGDLITRVNDNVKGLLGFMVYSFIGLVSMPVLFIGAVAFMLAVSWKLFLVSFALVPLAMYATTKLSKKAEKMWEESWAERGVGMSLIHDAISGIKEVKAYNLEAPIAEKVLERLGKSLHHLKEQARYYAFVGTPFGLLLHFSPQILCIFYGGYMVINRQMDAGYLAAFLQLQGYVMTPLAKVFDFYWSIRFQIACIHRLSKILDEPKERESGTSFAPNEKGPVVEFDAVSFSYRKEEKVLDNLSLTLAKGETVALVGPSGMGKTTVMSLLCGFYEATDGSIRVFGKDVRAWNLSSLRDQVAYVAQDVYLFPGTIEENISYGHLGARHEDIMRAAVAAHAHEFIMNLPAGYETLVGERGSRLSGGERQRISIARAILKNAPLLLLDEPTSSLDAQSEAYIQDALDKLSVGRTVLVAAHRMSTIKQAGTILVLGKDGIVEQGTHDELMAKSGLYQQLYAKQFAASNGALQQGPEHV